MTADTERTSERSDTYGDLCECSLILGQIESTSKLLAELLSSVGSSEVLERGDTCVRIDDVCSVLAGISQLARSAPAP